MATNQKKLIVDPKRADVPSNKAVKLKSMKRSPNRNGVQRKPKSKGIFPKSTGNSPSKTSKIPSKSGEKISKMESITASSNDFSANNEFDKPATTSKDHSREAKHESIVSNNNTAGNENESSQEKNLSVDISDITTARLNTSIQSNSESSPTHHSSASGVSPSGSRHGISPKSHSHILKQQNTRMLARQESSALLFSDSLYHDPLSDSESESNEVRDFIRKRTVPNAQSGLSMYSGVYSGSNTNALESNQDANNITVHKEVKRGIVPRSPIKIRTIENMEDLPIVEYGEDGPFGDNDNPFGDENLILNSNENLTVTDIIIPQAEEDLEDTQQYKPYKISIPSDFKDPITGYILIYPMQTTLGQVYEYDTIHAWFQNNDNDPITKSLVTDKRLTPAEVLMSRISTFIDKNPSLIADSAHFAIPKRMIEEVSEALTATVIDENIQRIFSNTIGRYMEAFLRQTPYYNQNLMHLLADHASFESFEYVIKELIGSDIMYIRKCKEILNQKDSSMQTPLQIAFHSTDSRLFLYMLSFFQMKELKEVATDIARGFGKKAFETYIENVSEMQYQNLINDIVRLDSSEPSFSSRSKYYKDREFKILKENEILDALQEVVNTL